MGLWPVGGRKQAEPKDEPEKRAARQQLESAQQPSGKADSTAAAAQTTEANASAGAVPDLPLPAVFEFGGAAVEAGITMKGICAADDPDQIQACLWRVDPAPKDTPKDESKYQILF